MQLHYSMKRFPASGLACPLVSASLFPSLELSINACSGVQRLVDTKCQLYWNSLIDNPPPPHPNALPIAVFQYSLFFIGYPPPYRDPHRPSPCTHRWRHVNIFLILCQWHQAFHSNGYFWISARTENNFKSVCNNSGENCRSVPSLACFIKQFSAGFMLKMNAFTVWCLSFPQPNPFLVDITSKKIYDFLSFDSLLMMFSHWICTQCLKVFLPVISNVYQ